jgi:hypothetical protein
VEPVSLKVTTYTREYRHVFSFDEIKSILKEAHKHCKDTVKATPHRIGKARRLVIAPTRQEYLNCIRNYINEKIKERIGQPPPPR